MTSVLIFIPWHWGSARLLTGLCAHWLLAGSTVSRLFFSIKPKGRAEAANDSCAPAYLVRVCLGQAAFPASTPPEAAPASMLCLCLYVPLIGEAQTEFQYFESKGLPAELKSIFKLSVFIPSQEFSTYRQWKRVCTGTQEAGRRALPHR